MQECHDLVKQLSSKKAGEVLQDTSKDAGTGAEKQQHTENADDMDGGFELAAGDCDGLAVEDPVTLAAKEFALAQLDRVHICTTVQQLKTILSRDVPWLNSEVFWFYRYTCWQWRPVVWKINVGI